MVRVEMLLIRRFCNKTSRYICMYVSICVVYSVTFKEKGICTLLCGNLFSVRCGSKQLQTIHQHSGDSFGTNNVNQIDTQYIISLHIFLTGLSKVIRCMKIWTHNDSSQIPHQTTVRCLYRLCLTVVKITRSKTTQKPSYIKTLIIFFWNSFARAEYLIL